MSLKRTRSPSDAGDSAYSAHVRIKKSLPKSFNFSMTRESTLRISNFNCPKNDDVDLFCGRTIAPANICMIITYSENKDISANEPVELVVDKPGVSVLYGPVKVINDM